MKELARLRGRRGRKVDKENRHGKGIMVATGRDGRGCYHYKRMGGPEVAGQAEGERRGGKGRRGKRVERKDGTRWKCKRARRQRLNELSEMGNGRRGGKDRWRWKEGGREKEEEGIDRARRNQEKDGGA